MNYVAPADRDLRDRPDTERLASRTLPAATRLLRAGERQGAVIDEVRTAANPRHGKGASPGTIRE